MLENEEKELQGITNNNQRRNLLEKKVIIERYP
jgi:hypothetical protein